MWRGKSNGDENADQSQDRSGGGDSGRSPSRRSGSTDPRSKSTGKKIRRIESGSPGGLGAPRSTSQGGPPPGGVGLERPTAPRSPRADPTDLGGPPSGPPGQPRSAGRTGRPPSTLGKPPAVGRGPSPSPGLPPLSQPTGELPRVQPVGRSDDTVAAADVGDQGVFAARGPDSLGGTGGGGRADGFRPGSIAAGAGESAGDMAPAFGAGSVPDDGIREIIPAAPTAPSSLARFDSPMPSAMPQADDPFSTTGDAPAGLGGSPAGDIFGAATGDVDADVDAIRSNLAAGPAEHAPTNPFPEVADDLAGDPYGSAGRPGSFDDPDATRVAGARTMAVGVSAAAARQGLGRPGGAAPLDAPTDIGPASWSDQGGPDPSDHLQDTEFKLADGRRKQKPKEPNRLILGLAVGLVLLAGVAVALFLTTGGDDDATEATDAEVVATPEATQDTTAATDQAAAAEPQVDEPTLFFDDAQTGPLQQGQTYSIDLVGEPEGSLLQVVVDDIPQGTPESQLPDLILPAGRHSLYIQISNGAETATSTAVEVYVLGDLPPVGFRANLSSVSIQDEGWVEALRQFDEFRAAGHEALQLYPLSEGYWNVFVAGLGEERASAQAYCESFGLAIPDQCFPTYYDGSAPPAATTGTTAPPADSSTTVAGG